MRPRSTGVAVFRRGSTFPGQIRPARRFLQANASRLISQGERLRRVRSATVYMQEGALSDEAVAAIKHYVINPIEARRGVA